MSRENLSKRVAIGEWLVLGAFPMEERAEGAWLQSGAPCEMAFAPEAGEGFAGRKWRICPDAGLDLLSPALRMHASEWSYAYALTYVRSPRRRRVRLLAKGAGAVAMWLNGKPIHEHVGGWSPERGPDVVPVTLPEGWSALLCKTCRTTGPWALTVEVECPGRARQHAGAEILGEATVQEALPWLVRTEERHCAGTGAASR